MKIGIDIDDTITETSEYLKVLISKYDKEYLRIMIAVFNNLVSNGAHSWEFYYFNYLDDEEPEGYVKDAVNFCFFGSYLLYHQYKTFKF